jgi:hypothetical protein
MADSAPALEQCHRESPPPPMRVIHDLSGPGTRGCGYELLSWRRRQPGFEARPMRAQRSQGAEKRRAGFAVP